jgi:MFS family permease
MQGVILPMHSVNDRSRWATVYSLAERGTYNIDETPWPDTIDRVRLNGHYYSSKPPLLPTLLAGEYLILKKLSFGRFSFGRSPETVIRVIVISVNLVPLVIFLFLFSGLLDRLAPGLWARLYSMTAAGLGTFLTGFSTTLNNHTIAAFSSFFALYPAFLIWREGERRGRLFAVAGFFSGFAAVNEFPALAFLVALGAGLGWKARRQTLVWFVPFALLPLAGHFWTNYLVTGDLRPAYLHKSAYIYPGSYWLIDPASGRLVGSEVDPLTAKPTGQIGKGIDNVYEPWPLYLFNILLGHHGIFSLSPIFFFTLMGIWVSLRSPQSPLRAFAILAAFLTLLLLVFYTFFAGQRNYGGMCCGLRWFFWLIPLWLMLLPEGLRGNAARPWFRNMALAFLLISAISVFYCARNPWSRSWIQQYLYYKQWIKY